MAKIFRSGGPNFPKDKDELEKRLKEVKELVNKSNANIKFVEAAFKLMEDCDLITEENIKFLSSAQSCESYDYDFRFPRNPNEGALRYVVDDNDVIGGLVKARFYSGNDRLVELNGNHYLISNDWYKDNNTVPNKSAFYNWLAEKATAACKAKWDEDKKNTSTPESIAALSGLQHAQIMSVLLEKAKRNGGKLTQSDLGEATQRPDLPLEKAVAEYECVYHDLIEKGIEIVDDTDYEKDKISDLPDVSPESATQEKPPEVVDLPVNIAEQKAPSENKSKTAQILKDFANLVYNLDRRVNKLEKILTKMENDIAELKNEW